MQGKGRDKAHPSCAGYLESADSMHAQMPGPSISMTTTGSSKGRISRMSPSVMRPGPYVESPRRVPVLIASHQPEGSFLRLRSLGKTD